MKLGVDNPLHGLSDAQVQAHIAEQESRIRFDTFPMEHAHAIGQALVTQGKASAAPIVVDITRGGQCLFHTALEGATPDNAHWVLRKNKVVNRFHHSSLFMGALCREAGLTLEQKYLLPENQFAAHGGAFPIILRDKTVIGTVTVSGLPQLDDHALVTQILEQFV